MKYLLNGYKQFIELNYNELFDKIFASDSIIKNNFCKIWSKIVQKIDLDMVIYENYQEIKNLVIYDILDGNRSTLTSETIDYCNVETTLYTLNLIHTLKSLGSRSCYIMIHTSYNRERGKKEFNQILKKIAVGTALIKKYAIQNNIRCFCIGMGKNYEQIHLLNDVMKSTENGDFHAYFLIDYNEKWIFSNGAQNVLDAMPDIDVHIRHTKFQVSGGWIPDLMSHSVFLYSQNGSVYSNWNLDEILTLLALSLLAKLIHRGEILSKTYVSEEEINQRYRLRELKLFNKVIKLQANPKKLIVIGSPQGVYQFYF